MLQSAPAAAKYTDCKKAIQEIISELHKWESADSCFFHQIWITSTGHYSGKYHKLKSYDREIKAGEILSCSSDREPLKYLSQSFSETATAAGIIIHHIYRPENLPGFISFRIERNKQLQHFVFEE